MKYKIIKGSAEEVQERINIMLKYNHELYGDLITLSDGKFAQAVVEKSVNFRMFISVLKVFILFVVSMYIVASIQIGKFDILKWTNSELFDFAGTIFALLAVAIGSWIVSSFISKMMRK